MAIKVVILEEQKGAADGVAELDGAVRNAQPPQLHAGEHVDGTDNIQDATDSVKGLATPTQITKLNAIEPDATKSTFVEQANFTYCSQSKGSDLTGDGSLFNPFETIQHAINLIGEDEQRVIIVDDDEESSFQNVTLLDAGSYKSAIIVFHSSLASWYSGIQNLVIGNNWSILINSGAVYGDVTETLGCTWAELYCENGIIDSTPNIPNTDVLLFGTLMSEFYWDNMISNSKKGSVFDVSSGKVFMSSGAKVGGKLETVTNGTLADDGMAFGQRYTDGEAGLVADAKIGVHAAIPGAHHAKYLDSEAVTAMGVKDDTNPLNHDRTIQATESVIGIAEIATQVETDAGTDDTRIITPLKLANKPEPIINDRLGFRMFPTSNGQIDIIGWNIVTDSAFALSNATPLTISEPGYHSHIMLDASSVVGAPFDLTITGRSVDENTGVESPGDTEIISITADGWYQSTKSWIDAVVLSVPVAKTLTVDVYRNTYWDRGNKDFTITGSRLEWTPDVTTWSIKIEVLKVNNDGSITTVDSTTFANTDGVPRAANGKPGKYKRGNYNTIVNGAQKEGLIIRMTQTNIGSFYVEVKYNE